MQANIVTGNDSEMAVNDLGPLAWVLDELRKSLDGATKAIRRFVRDAELARGSDLESLDASQLRIARQQLHQAVGALEMVGLAEPAKVLRAMETLAQKFVQHPEFCSEESAAKVERASFALSEYLEGVLRGKKASSVALFPQYREVLELLGEDRIHPAELWPVEWRWIDAPIPQQIKSLSYEQSVRAKMDSSVLKMVKTGNAASSKMLRDICLGLSVAQERLEPRVFWKIAAAFFEGVSLKLIPVDVYVKRASSRVLMHYSLLAKGGQEVSDRLAQDLLFFCSQAGVVEAYQAPVLATVRSAYGLSQTPAVDYVTTQFGRFDPALLVQVRKRIATATETWSALAGGDTNRLKMVADQFNLVSESLLKLHAENSELSRALLKAVEITVRSGEPPTTPVAMEVATAILYLDAAYEDMDPTDSQMADRSLRLARRLDHVIGGGQPEALEGWMEDLYRRVSDRQTMGSVVEELRTALTEIEKSLDIFFRNPSDKVPLHEVPSQLAQMRGVFSVLGLDQASTATLRMRDSVEKFLNENVEPDIDQSYVFEKLGNSLGALGFLIDMLSYQRALAKKLFVYDEDLGEFKPLMGRGQEDGVATVPPAFRATVAPKLAAVAPPVAAAATTMQAPAPAKPAVSAPTSRTVKAAQAAPDEDNGEELREIFLEEAREVIQTGKDAIRDLGADPGNLGLQTTLRRAFHTLKGSSRMVGYTEFGEAAWAMEQMLNSWLAEQKPVEQDLLALSSQAMDAFHKWVEDISRGTDTVWSAAPFRRSADSQRFEHTYLELELPESARTSPAPIAFDRAAPVSFDFDPQPMAGMVVEDNLDFDATHRVQFQVTETPSSADAFNEPSTEAAKLSSMDSSFGGLMSEIDFGSLAGVTQRTPLSPGEELATPTELSGLSTDFWGTDTKPGGAEDFGHQTLAVDLSSARTEMGSLDGVQWGSGQEPTRYHGLESPGQSHETTEMQGLGPQASNDSEDQVKVIGSLRIGIPLYNVYLNEADEWSRRLLTELNEWALELHQPISDSSVALAHSLAGSSGTVGFMALSDIARSLEHALQHVQLHGQGFPAHAKIFVAAAENIRHLLHQFAAGFLKEPEPGLLESLADILSTEFAPMDGLPEIRDFNYKPMPAVPSRSSQDTVKVPIQLEPDSFEQDFSLDFVSEVPAPLAAQFVPMAPVRGVAPLIGAAQIVDVDREEEIDAVDNIDPDLFPIFEEEAAELLPQLGGALRQWSATPEDMEARLDVLRVLHTLKGSARLSGAMRLGEMAHRMESVVEQLGTEVIQHSQVEPLLHRFDRLQQCFDDLRAGPEQSAPQTSVTEPEFLPSDTFDSIPEFALSEPPVPEAVSPLPVAPIVMLGVPAKPVPMTMAPGKPVHVPATARQSGGQSVRVRSQLLDRLVNQAGEVMISRSRLDARLGQLNGSLGELTTNLDRLRGQLRDVEVQSESQMQSRLALAKDSAQGFDPLEFDRFTRVQELTRMMAESVSDVATVQRNLQRTIAGTEDDLIAQGRQARELQRDLLRTRMVEFESIAERLYGVVRQSGKEVGKQVKLDITGGSLEVDRGVLDRMTPAFEHMLRNSIAHGIEDARTREAAGKPATGTITIGLSHGGNDVSVSFSDDGAGLNLQRIREKALSNGLLAPGQSMSDAEAANLIFMPGFSTASSVTEMAGRGIGMDVVRSEVNALGGRIETATQAGQGTQFTLVLPLTTAVTQVIMLRMGELTIGVPSNLVDIVQRTKPDDLAKAYETSQIEYGGEILPFFWSGALLQASTRSRENEGKPAPVVVFRSAGQRMAAHVDEVLGNQEVVVKNLGPQLSRLPGLAGMSVLASGAVVLIYNPVALTTFYGQGVIEKQNARSAAKLASGGEAPVVEEPTSMFTGSNELPLVLVVDDSITVRRVTQRLLKREGYRVALANDGFQALERLREERPTLVLSDIEMPRMDGFDLVRNIRNDEKLRDLPVIMITSRIAEKHREHARQLGVDHYLGKPFVEDELLRLVRHYCAQAISN
jgi:chemosensory pili system protein ChpA (sensor histidine kinase/response regulator)